MLQWQNLGGIMFHIFTLAIWTVNDDAEHQSPCITCTGHKCDHMWQVWPHVTCLTTRSMSKKLWEVWPLVTIVTTCDNCDHLWQAWPLVTSMTTCDKCDHLWQVWPLVTNMKTCDKCDHLRQSWLTTCDKCDNLWQVTTPKPPLYTPLVRYAL